MAFEGSFQEGVKRETLRSLCQVVNATQLNLEVALAPVADDDWQQVPVASSSRTSLSSRPSSSSRASSVGEIVEEEVFENERFLPIRGWSSGNLLPTDRRRYSHGRQQPAAGSTSDFPRIQLPDGPCDFAVFQPSLSWHPPVAYSDVKGMIACPS